MSDTALQMYDCSKEPIHVPGSIQPYGILLVVDSECLHLRHVAGDVEGRLGFEHWHDASLADAVGPDVAGRVAALVRSQDRVGFVGRITTCFSETLDVSAARSGDHLLIELEPAADGDLGVAGVLARLEALAACFERAPSLAMLCQDAASAFQTLTEFDRVMVYQFRDDGSGSVVAEATRDGIGSFLNHHFPASDIPRQARALYLRNLTRVIPDATYRAAPLRPAWTASEPLDMSDSSLRSVSPIHLQYLQNMGVRASASVSIVKDGALWGLIACHNETPRFMPFDIRASCQALAGTLAREIKVREESESYRQRIRLRSFEDDIFRLLSREGSLDDALSNHLDQIRFMMGADGVAVLRGKEHLTGGMHPPESAVRDFAAWLRERPMEFIFQSDNLSTTYPPACQYQELASGVLALTLSVEEPWQIIWFRAEQIEVVNWAGNPHKEANAEPGKPLTPRNSFSAWQETVRGQARRWSLPEIEAAMRLRSALLDFRQSRRIRDLNQSLTQILREKDALLDQKDFLIGEVNHRVQNSLQLVGSFLALQGRASDSPEVRDALDEARRRLSAVALVHRRLYRDEQVRTVDTARYFEELCDETIASLGQEWRPHLTMNIQSALIPTDRAVTLGLVVTELMININKYAYEGRPGPIAIRLEADNHIVRITVADHGQGRSSSRQGFGSRMMEGLLAQIGGTLIYSDNGPGLRAEVSAGIGPKS